MTHFYQSNASVKRFVKDLTFTVDKFENETPHFLDLEISPNSNNNFSKKNTHTGQYININANHAIIERILSEETLANNVISNKEKDKIPIVFINIDYPGEKGKHLLKKCFKKFVRSTKSKKCFCFSMFCPKIVFFHKY